MYVHMQFALSASKWKTTVPITKEPLGISAHLVAWMTCLTFVNVYNIQSDC